MMGNFDLVEILYSLPAVFLAISFHEWAHAFIAYRMGDPTPKIQGRLTLDPLAHVDWIGLIMFVIFGFGWAKPVQVNSANFRNRKRGDLLVSIAGPIANVILSFFVLLVVHILVRVFPYVTSNQLNNVIGIIFPIFYKIAYLNIVFAFLNLIPIPPFDGYKVMKTLFFRRNIKFFWLLERYSMIILLAMVLLNLFGYIVSIPSMYTYAFLDNITAWIIGAFL
jgi:Zn-dependent protease